MGSAGSSEVALIQIHHLAGDFRDKLNPAMTSKMESLETLQCQMNFLAGMVLKNRKTLDLIIAEHGGFVVW